LRGAATVGKHGHAAISRLERDTFESHFHFVMVDLNVYHFSAKGVNECSVRSEVHDAKVGFATFTVQERQGVRHAFFDRVGLRVETAASKTSRVSRTVNSPEAVRRRRRSGRDPRTEASKTLARAGVDSTSDDIARDAKAVSSSRPRSINSRRLDRDDAGSAVDRRNEARRCRKSRNDASRIRVVYQKHVDFELHDLLDIRQRDRVNRASSRSRTDETARARTIREQFERDVVRQVTETTVHLEFCSVHKRARVRFRLFHKEVGDRNELVVFDHIDEEASQLARSLLVLSVRETMRTALWRSKLDRYQMGLLALLSAGFLSDLLILISVLY